MIDVVMVLIVFYLLVGQLAIDRKAQIDLPGSSIGELESQDKDPLIIGITQAGLIMINGESIEPERFQGMIEGMFARDPSIQIRIRADREAKFGIVRPVLHQIREIGITHVEFVTEQQR